MTMTSEADAPAVLDVAFALEGDQLPSDHRAALWQAVAAVLPWLEDEADAGIHPLRIIETSYGVALLPKRAKLTLRVPAHLKDRTLTLSGAELDVATSHLKVGAGKAWRLPEASTFFSELVTTGSEEEASFRQDIENELARLGVTARLIFGRARSIYAGGRRLAGFPVALHDVTREGARRLLKCGLGGERHLGCGILVQHKAITGLD